jgi:hypothetical protein
VEEIIATEVMKDTTEAQEDTMTAATVEVTVQEVLLQSTDMRLLMMEETQDTQEVVEEALAGMTIIPEDTDRPYSVSKQFSAPAFSFIYSAHKRLKLQFPVNTSKVKI